MRTVKFKGKGCDQCPFYTSYEGGDNEEHTYCILKGVMGKGDDTWVSWNEKPDDCPFRAGESIEICAEEIG